MHSIKFSSRIITAVFSLLIWMVPANAESFNPMRFLQDASVVSAIATAVAQLESCEENLLFSEEKSDKDGDITVTVACNKFPNDEGKLGRSTVRIEFELNKNGSVGAPLEFSYD